jgi:hypothetical protein
MEIVGLLDNLTAKLVALLYVSPPNIGSGLNGHSCSLSYKVEIVGLSPLPPTYLPPHVWVFVTIIGCRGVYSYYQGVLAMSDMPSDIKRNIIY